MNGNYERPMNGTNNRNNRSNGGSNNGNNGNSNNTNSSSGNNMNNTNSSASADMEWLDDQIRRHPEFRTPPQQSFDSEEMEGSIQKILAENIGTYIVVEFLIGTDRIHRKQGYLYHVGTSYITLYDDENDNFILCDIFSVKFVYFYLPGQRPNRNFNILPTSNGNMG